MESSKATTKRENKEVPTAYHSLPNQNTILTYIIRYYFKRYGKNKMKYNLQKTKGTKKFKNKQFTSLTRARAYLPRVRWFRSSV